MTARPAGLTGVHIYEHLGVVSQAIDDESGETRMPVNDDVRTGGGFCAAPLGLAFENGVANYLYAKMMAVPTQIALHVRDQGASVDEIRSLTRITRVGRSMAVTDGEILDAADPQRMIAFGTIIWSVIGPPPERSGEQPERPTFNARGADIIEACGITPLADGSGCELASLTPQTLGPGGILHAGMSQLLCEEAALIVGRTTLDHTDVVAVDCVYNFLQAGKTGAFVAGAQVLASGVDGVDCKVLLRDAGNEDRVVTYALVRVRPS